MQASYSNGLYIPEEHLSEIKPTKRVPFMRRLVNLLPFSATFYALAGCVLFSGVTIASICKGVCNLIAMGF